MMLLASSGCEDPDSLSSEEALLEDANDDLDAEDQLVMSEPSDDELPGHGPSEPGPDGFSAPDDDDGVGIYGGELEGPLLLVHSVSTAGSTVVVPSSATNDPVWALNAPNFLSGSLSRVTATIVHDGFLNGPNGWDHLAVLTRGTSLESSLQYLGFSSGTPSAFFWGEDLQSAGNGSVELTTMARGRGPTIWAKGSTGICSNALLPCLKFENYSMNFFPGDILVGPSVALPLTSDPFQLRVDTTDTDIKVWVSQGGQLKAYASCLEISGGDSRCGARPGDGAMGDAIFGFVMQNPLPNFANRHAGVLNASSKILHGWID
ncbi:MAG: hypothetical protein H6712_21825 [Myxococcales bacterium]|nr:hypothetical protein [Myxococcales bacterium]MCB9716516.1 hypothetical protein [Myxococcales bacterium]